MEQWYALHTKSRQEARVAARLADLEIETLAPRVWHAGATGTRRQVAFFPCYIFARLDLTTRPSWEWQWTPGLRRIVTFADTPAAVPAGAIALIRSRVDELNRDRGEVRNRFRPGDPVRITRGPLADVAALFERETTPGERVSVLLDFLGRIIRAQVNTADLERLAPDAMPAQSRPPRRTRGHGRFITPRE